MDLPPTTAANADAMPRRVDVAVWMGSRREMTLLYLGQEYRLRITKLGKLILTKYLGS